MDTIFINGRISTLDPAKPAATAIALDDGLIAAVGDDRMSWRCVRHRRPSSTCEAGP
jgi:predicted amidohydrolase YtcJ